MQNYPTSFDAMLAAWNETDPTKVREHLNSCLTEDVYFCDPSVCVTGIDAFEKNVHEVQNRLPSANYVRTSDVDHHHNLYRYHWAIYRDDELLIQGFDVVEAREGKVARVLGFFDDLPNRL